ncbi:hypothetical protein [Brevibacillus porteri]|uniref:hypothetical protein n=1 Tax=Brevibacillus porteri TaxID=2126350 RepID=UPI002E227548|nr:hypothetical protein [Brevibacillus porteri]MED2892332.1 hypothetical protein [Brevibacillus porteri]
MAGRSLGNHLNNTINALQLEGICYKYNTFHTRRNPQLYRSPVTCLEGDRPNEGRKKATGKHVAGLPPDHNSWEATQ